VLYAPLPNEYYMIIIFNQDKKGLNLAYLIQSKSKYVAFVQHYDF